MGCRSHVPGWHEKTKALQAAGKLQVVGLIQEQHPERCRLFMQWKGMRWPVLVDSLNLLGVGGVPLAFLLDEHGVVRKARPNERSLKTFLQTDYAEPEGLPPPASAPSVDALTDALRSAGSKSATQWRTYGDALFLRGRPKDLTSSIRAYRKSIELDDAPETWFRLGVALRRRFESATHQPGDFQLALDAWGRALAARPNQYIWRRRIQQYGPRLEKPYAFYDWVENARREIRARGETPVVLPVEPKGSELANKSRSFSPAGAVGGAPDPEDRIRHDKAHLIRVETAVAPARVAPGKSARAYVVLRPDPKLKAHWNNEARQLQVWLDPPAGVEVDRRLLTIPNAKTAASTETRELEFEVRVPKNAPRGKLTIDGYALYFVCEDVDGVCMFLRQDLKVTVDVTRK